MFPSRRVFSSDNFVRAFTESLRAQLAGTGVTVSEAAPGPVESEFDQAAGIEGGATPGQGIFRITAQECAADIVQEFEKGTLFPGTEPSLDDEGATPHAAPAVCSAGRASGLQTSSKRGEGITSGEFSCWRL